MASIDVEDENILTSIFKDAFPDSWQDRPDFVQYLVELSSCGVERLAREPERLAEERSQILAETQDLAFHNYTTFIQTADCSKTIFKDFQIIEQHVDNVLTKLPPFAEECEKVVKKAQEISSSRRMNTLTLQRHTQLLEILEMPQVMDTCVRNAYYEEALELAAHVKRLEKKHSTIPVIMSIVQEVKASTQLMLNQLIQQLRTNLQLPACLRVIGFLRRMDVFTEAELRIKFLQARDSWFQTILDSIPKDDPYVHITKTIEMSRVHLFDIITQYRAIFSDEDPLLTTSRDETLNETALFHGWVVQKVSQFLATLERDLVRGVGGRLDSLLGQCMYFGLSFSRVGADFRGLLAPIVTRAALTNFKAGLKEANQRFEENMQSYNLLGVSATGTGLSYGTASQTGTLYPPTVLLEFYPLAAYCNHVLTTFNELRLCAPINLACDVADNLQASLTEVNRIILAFFRAEETTFNEKESEQFGQFCATYVTDLLPYVNKCLQTLFPTSQLAQALGISVAELHKLGNIGQVDLKTVLSQVDHLIPVVNEPEPPEIPVFSIAPPSTAVPVPSEKHVSSPVPNEKPGPSPAVSVEEPGSTPAVSVEEPGQSPAVSVEEPGSTLAVSMEEPGQSPAVSMEEPGQSPAVLIEKPELTPVGPVPSENTVPVSTEEPLARNTSSLDSVSSKSDVPQEHVPESATTVRTSEQSIEPLPESHPGANPGIGVQDTGGSIKNEVETKEASGWSTSWTDSEFSIDLDNVPLPSDDQAAAVGEIDVGLATSLMDNVLKQSSKGSDDVKKQD